MKNNLDTKKQSGPAMVIMKKLAKRYFIDAFTGMAHGLFVTLIAGTIIKTIGTLIGEDTAVGSMLILIGNIAAILMGAGIGAGIASHLNAPKLVIFGSMVAGIVGAFSSQFIGPEFIGGSMESITGLMSKGIPGNPIGSYVCAIIACEVGTFVSGKTKLDILLVPLSILLITVLSSYVAYPFIWLIGQLGIGISSATEYTPFVMGIVIAVIMGILLTLPTSSAAIWISIASTVSTDAMLLAGGAAVVGCACHMVGFAVASYRENKFSGLISQGLGTSMLQIPNIMRNPKIMLPAIVASAILGPISTTGFKLMCNASGGGMGTSGLVGVFGTIEASTGVISTGMMWTGIILLMFVLPAIISLVVSEILRKIGWIKPNDMLLK